MNNSILMDSGVVIVEHLSMVYGSVAAVEDVSVSVARALT